MSQPSHAEDASFTHEGEGSVTATEGEWVRAHPSYTKIQLIRVVGFFITLVGVFAALTVMFEMMRSSDVLPKPRGCPLLPGDRRCPGGVGHLVGGGAAAPHPSAGL